ncbi:MAG TPA: glutamate 5-kinase, partial [Hyphomicrobiaceae bacterium]|nr:glutamate 5-kinase [Hyphomicrobiaceae bacterium]
MAVPDKAQQSKTRPEWARARRIVVKIGSSLLIDRASGELKSSWLATLADDIADLVGAGRQVIVVSSGAIALGRHVLSFARSALELEKSQAAAAVGQISLAGAYQTVFKARGLVAAQ